jgi:hypothetical protein
MVVSETVALAFHLIASVRRHSFSRMRVSMSAIEKDLNRLALLDDNG